MNRNYSFSQNRLYETCPFKYKLTYIDKIREPSNSALDLGNAVHKFAELEGWKFHMGSLWPANVAEAYNNIIKLKTHSFASNVHESFNRFWKDKKILASEAEFIVDGIIYKIDVLYTTAKEPNVLIVADYKVTKYGKTVSSILEEAQLLCYKYAALQNIKSLGDFDTIKVQYINILPLDIAKMLTYTEPMNIDNITCENYIASMKANIAKIDNGMFQKNVSACHMYGKHCFYKECGYCNGCKKT